MKENSWREIALLMNVSCQNRWLRLRERFIREKRFRELETRSISRISRHTAFTLYKNMLFLDSHIKRRCYSNVTNSIAKIQKIHRSSIHYLKINVDIENISPEFISGTKSNNFLSNLFASLYRPKLINLNTNSLLHLHSNTVQSKIICKTNFTCFFNS